MSLSLRSIIQIRTLHKSWAFGPAHRPRISHVSPVLSKGERRINGLVGPSPRQEGFQGEEEAEASKDSKSAKTGSEWNPTFLKMFESAATTLASIVVLA